MSRSEEEKFGFEILDDGTDVIPPSTAMEVAETMVTQAGAPTDLFGNVLQVDDIIAVSISNRVRIGRVECVYPSFFNFVPIAPAAVNSRTTIPTRWTKCGGKRTFRLGASFVILTPLFPKHFVVIV